MESDLNNIFQFVERKIIKLNHCDIKSVSSMFKYVMFLLLFLAFLHNLWLNTNNINRCNSCNRYTCGARITFLLFLEGKAGFSFVSKLSVLRRCFEARTAPSTAFSDLHFPLCLRMIVNPSKFPLSGPSVHARVIWMSFKNNFEISLEFFSSMCRKGTARPCTQTPTY